MASQTLQRGGSADEDVMASHYRITVEDDGSKRLCTWSTLDSGLDLLLKILELNEAGNKVRSQLL